MSGPVWKRLRTRGTCDVTGETCEELMAVGTVVDFVFYPELKLGPEAYERYKGHYDELVPRIVDEQKTPPRISRPSHESDF